MNLPQVFESPPRRHLQQKQGKRILECCRPKQLARKQFDLRGLYEFADALKAVQGYRRCERVLSKASTRQLPTAPLRSLALFPLNSGVQLVCAVVQG